MIVFFKTFCGGQYGFLTPVHHRDEDMSNIVIKEAYSNQLDTILAVERAAFSSEPTIVVLVSDLLNDPSARPILSLLAVQDEQSIGHILFSKVQLDSTPSISAAILAPLAVIPSKQKQGVGQQLVFSGLQILTDAGVELVFVLGYPTYYSRFGFQTATILGFVPPYPIADKNIDAWMVKALKPNVINKVRGKVVCADALNKTEYWIE